MKRFISLGLTFAILFSLCTTASAKSTNIISDPSTVNNETISFLDRHHIDSERLIGVISKDEGPQTYIYQWTDTVRSEITVEGTSNGRLLTIKEGDLLNTLEITNDGRYILNGNVVTFSSSETIPPSGTGIIMPRYPVDTYYTEDCPYGSDSDYTDYYTFNAKSNIGFGTAFAQITITAFIAILGAVVSPVLGLAASFATAILSSFQEYDPHSMCASYKETQYLHETKGLFVTIDKSAIMYDMDLWPKADYKGTRFHTNAFQVTLWENGEG